ncbi:uncharacterized protein LOC142577734 [Dermacentor variabilis]|uniref:uncharacterized protein LOC142577734 n=1 Tax=Dermacentor variabilis TaxID=34621 RepID=UPI003F5C3BA4
MPPVSKKDQGATLPGFAKILVKADARVFVSIDDVLAIFEAADEEFCNDGTTYLSATCTFSEKSSCWAVQRQREWNKMFNHRGIEMIELQKGTLHFRTLDVDPEDLPVNTDVKFLCLCLWLLRQHRCISGVVLSIPVLAPRHESLFLSLLKLTEFLQKCEMHGNDPFTRRALAKAEPRATALDHLSRLRELRLAMVHLIDDDVAVLARLVERNALLVAFVLIDVEMSALAFDELAARVVEHKKLEDFRVKISAKEPESTFNDALSKIGKSSTISRLYVHVDHGLLSLLQGLLDNSTVGELTLEPAINDAKVVCALADFLEKCPSCRRLKASFNANKFSHIAGTLADLQRIVGNSSLRVLVLSGSALAPLPARRLADGLALSTTLRKLYVDDCGLGCKDVLPFVRAVRSCMQYDEFEELDVGAPIGKQPEQWELFRTIVELGVCRKVTLVYNDCLVEPLREALQTNIKFVNVSLSYGEDTEAETVLHALRSTVKTIEKLCISTPRVLSSLGGQFLANLIRKADSLKVLRLRCRTKANASIQIVKAIAESRSVVLLSTEHWDLSEHVQRAFADMLRKNRSLYRLEFYWGNVGDYESFKGHLIKGLEFNQSVSVVKMYHGQERDELAVCDFELLQCVRKNAMLLAWVTDVILRDGMCPEGAAVIDLLNTCEAPLDLFQRTGDFSPRTANNRIRLARMETRTQFYALISQFRGRPDFHLTASGRVLFQNLLHSMRDDVLSSMGLETSTASGASCSSVE